MSMMKKVLTLFGLLVLSVSILELVINHVQKHTKVILMVSMFLQH